MMGLVARLTSAIAIWVVVGFGASVGCRKTLETKGTIDAGLAACIPPDGELIAGINLAALRASPLYAKTPPAAKAFAEQLGGVSSALASYNGRDLLIALRGSFKAPPAGAAILAPDLALIGSPERIAAASAQYQSGRTGAPALLTQAEPLAAGAQLWVVARGNARLPLTGNAANLAGILRRAHFVTLTARTSAGLSLELRALAPDVDLARAIEETLRADLTLAAAGEAKRADVAGALRSAQVTRAEREVRVTLTMSDDVAGRLLAAF
jgi:hypothetical protein